MLPDARLHLQMGIAIFLPYSGLILSQISHCKRMLALFNGC